MQIQKRNKAYRIIVSCGYDDSGKQIRHTTTFNPPKGLTSKQEQKAVLEFGEQFERKIRGGSFVQYNRMTFKSFCYDLYIKNHLPSLKPKTASGYRTIIEKRLIPYFGDMLIRNITSLDVRKWLASLERTDGRSEVSRHGTCPSHPGRDIRQFRQVL